MGRKSKKPPRKQCPYGFTCSQITSQPNIIAEYCWFLKDCREIKKDSNSNIDGKVSKFQQQILEVTKKIVQSALLNKLFSTTPEITTRSLGIAL